MGLTRCYKTNVFYIHYISDPRSKFQEDRTKIVVAIVDETFCGHTDKHSSDFIFVQCHELLWTDNQKHIAFEAYNVWNEISKTFAEIVGITHNVPLRPQAYCLWRSNTLLKCTGLFTKAILPEKYYNPIYRCLEWETWNQIFKGWYAAHCSPTAICCKDPLHKVNWWSCRQTFVLRGWRTKTNKSAEWSKFMAEEMVQCSTWC